MPGSWGTQDAGERPVRCELIGFVVLVGFVLVGDLPMARRQACRMASIGQI